MKTQAYFATHYPFYKIHVINTEDRVPETENV